MSKKEREEMTNDVLIADALIRVKTLEVLLINKGIFTKEEFESEMITVTSELTKRILEKAQLPADVEEIFKKIGLKGNQN